MTADQNTASETRNRLVLLAASASVLVAAVLVGIKTLAFALTGSVALLSSLVDSVLDLTASGFNFFAVRHATVPADHEHRFGHGKAEALAALAQTAFISASVVFILITAVRRFLHPDPVTHGDLGILVMLVSIGATIILVLFQRSVATRTGSLAISADLLHYASDLLSNVAVLIALAASRYLHWELADPVIAVLIALWMALGVKGILIKSLDELMDRELLEPQRQQVIDAAMNVAGVQGVHDVRTRSAGPHAFVQMRVEVNGNQSLFAAHDIAERVEDSVMAVLPNAEVIVHQDPVRLQPVTRATTADANLAASQDK